MALNEEIYVGDLDVEQPEIEIGDIEATNEIPTGNHNDLYNRDADNQHPIRAITGLQDALDDKVDKVEGKGLSENDFTDEYKSKVDSAIQPGDNISELTNDSEFINKDVNDLTNYTKTSDLGDLATQDTVDYETQVTNKPAINNGKLTIQKNGVTVAEFTANSNQDVTANILADTQLQSDWNQNNSSAPDYIKNKPTIPVVNNATLTIQKNGTTIATFTANSSQNVTANIEADAQVQSDWAEANSSEPDYIKNKPDLSGFITNTVDNLVYYYLKSETYTQAEVNALIGAIKTIKAEIVAELPTASADTYFNTSKTIYMVANSSQSGNDYYDEYITVRSGTEGDYTYSWEKIGNTQIDLSNYVQKTFTIAGIDMQDNISASELNTALDTVTISDAQTITGKKTFNGNITVDSQIDMGTGAIKYSYNNIGFNLNGTDIYIFADSTFQPNGSTNSNRIDLGGQNRYWKDLYLAGNLKDGTNSISIANIENKTDYTKVTALSGSAAPTTATVASFVGQIYIDTTNNKIYQCTAITEDTSTTPSTFTYSWIPLNDIKSISTPTATLTPDANGNVEIPYMSTSPGLVRYSGLPTGLAYNYALNELMLSDASNTGIDNRANAYGTGYGAITPKNLDYAVSTTYLKGNSAPTTSTVGFVGQLYLNSSDNVTYQCTAVTTVSDVTTYTWKKLANVPIYREVSSADIFPPSNVAFEYPGQICVVQDTRYGRYHHFICRQASNGSYYWALLTPNTGTGTDSISLGQDSSATGYGSAAYGAGAHATANWAIQLGSGTNSTAQSFNVGFGGGGANYQLLNSSGKIPQERFSDCLTGNSAPTTSTVASYIGQLYKDTTNNKLYICDGITEDTSTSPSTFTYTWTQLIRITDKANNDNFGVVRLAQGRGLDLLSDGRLFVDVAGDVQITNRTIGRPLSTERINFAVLSALTDANHLTMTSAQQATAQSVLGIDLSAQSPRGIARL